jgi:ABC-type phosphate/phosphonate transport system substrate-binding protein
VSTDQLLLGAVAYDAKVVAIWNGFRQWLRQRGVPLDYILYSNYERQVDDLLAGHIDVAWNSPLAWERTRRSAGGAQALLMRDTDRDLTSVIVVRADSPVRGIEDLKGGTVATGAVDSPQGTLLPLALLGDVDVTVRRFDVGVGLHGDHIGGERDAARALASGEVDAACMLDASHLLFGQEGTLPPGNTRIVAQTPPFDHCNMTLAGSTSPHVRPFVESLLSMDYADEQARPLLDLEGLKRWLPGRTDGYGQIAAAVDERGFYGPGGEVIAEEYAP